MKSLRIFPAVVALFCFAFSNGASAVVDANAPVVKLRTTCKEGAITLDNCFTSMGALMGWIGTRLPTASNPLSVEIGPGQFDGFNLNGVGDISFRGAGPDKTTIGRVNQAAINIANSNRLNFQDLKVTGGFPAPVYWQGGGSSTWTNVHLAGSLYAWTETNCNATTGRAKHYWFNSRFTSSGKGYLAACSENWFFGSEIAVEGPGLGGVKGLLVFGQPSFGISPEAHLYGSTIRVKPSPGTSFSTPTGGSECSGVVAVCAGLNGNVHIHGTGIDVIGNDMPNDVAALVAGDGGEIHANQSAFNMSTAAGGKVIRILNAGGHIHAPYLWEHIPASPLGSITGADITTVTTGTSDGHPHLVIYDTSCASKWYDTVDKVCRP
jgi:hypothetical protein